MSVALAIVAVVDARRNRTESRPARTSNPGRLSPVLVLAVAGALAAGIHFAIAPQHWTEDPLYGAFFLSVASAQLTGALLILRRANPGLLRCYAAGNVALVLLWLASRTVGIPLGAARGEVESIGLFDIVASASELVAFVCCLRLLRGTVRAPLAMIPLRR